MLRALDDPAEERARIEPAECGRGGRGRRSRMVATAMPKQRTVSAHQRKPIAAVPHSAMTSAGTERRERDEKEPLYSRPSAHGPPRLRGGHLANRRDRQDGIALTLEHTRSRVDLAMAVRAQHHALEELCRDRLPRARHPVLRDTKLLLAGVPMVKFEERVGNDPRAAAAPIAHYMYRSCFFASCRHRPSIVVPPSVAVRAQKVTLRSLGDEPFPGSVEVAKPELLRLRVPVMKLQRGDIDVIAAVFTAPASDFDQALLTLYPPPSLTAIRRIAPPLSSIQLGLRPPSDRTLRSVVISKRRACKTEFPSMERSKLFIDHLLRPELATAKLTRQHPRWARVIEARAMPRLERQTLEALAAPMEMATLSIDDLVGAEG